MATRRRVRKPALLFGSNSMYDLLVALARESGQFHAAALSRRIGHSPSQTNRELAKLRTLGIVERVGVEGRRELLRLADDPLVDGVLELPNLLAARLRSLGQP